MFDNSSLIATVFGAFVFYSGSGNKYQKFSSNMNGEMIVMFCGHIENVTYKSVCFRDFEGGSDLALFCYCSRVGKAFRH